MSDDVNQDLDGIKTSSSPDNYAYCPDPKHPTSWKLEISDPSHVAMAITALSPEGFQGSRVEIPADKMKEVLGRIRGKIEAMGDGDQKDHLMHRLESLPAWKREHGSNADTDNDGDSGADTDHDGKAVTIESLFVDETHTTAVKALDASGDRVGGYLVLFGNAHMKDLTKEYFTPQTEFQLDLYDKRPALYHHGLDSSLKTTAVGVIDKIEVDDVGLWAEAQLNKRNRYNAQIKELVAKGALGWSSGSVPHWVERKRDGQITKWPIVEGSLTPTPAEPRGTDIGFIPGKAHLIDPDTAAAAYKSIGFSSVSFATPTRDEADENAPQDRGAGFKAETGVKTVLVLSPETPKAKESPIMSEALQLTEEQLNALLDKRIAAKAAEAEAAAKTKADEEARINAEVERRLAAKAAETPAPGGTPLPNPGQAPKGDKVVVVDDLRFSGLNSQDMGYYAWMMNGYGTVASLKAQRNMARNPLEERAIQFFREARTDENRSFERAVAAKALREVNRDQMPDEVVELLPYKSLADVDANRYDGKVNDLAIKANELDNSGQSSYGLEWVPTMWANQVWRKVRMANAVAANMEQIDMPSNPYKLPIEGTDPVVSYISEATDLAQLVYNSGNSIPVSKIGTGAPSITASKLGLRVAWSSELVEDVSIFPVISNLRRQAERVLRNTVDNTILNGDTATAATTNINLIDGTPTAGTSYLAMNGLLKYALVTNTSQAINAAGAPTLPFFRNMRKKLSKHYAMDLPNLVYVVGFEVYMKMLNMPEFSNWLNMGQPGSNVTGLLPGGSPDQVGDAPRMVGMIDGIPCYASAELGLAQSTGKISGTPANNTLGTATLYHRSRWYLGFRRQISLDVVQLQPLSDTYQLWAMVRFGLVSFDTQSAAVGYNIDVS